MIVYTAEKDQIKYFVQNYLGKITFSYVQTATWLSSCCHKLRLFKFVKSYERFFQTAGSWNALHYERPPHQIEYII